jgi:nucleoside-diphosphate-sugar epimerase
MKIVITGGAGFVGSQVGYYFHKLGHDVFLVDNMSYGKKDNLIIDGNSFGTFVKADIREKDTDRVYKSADLVLHFAGIAPLPDCQISPENAYDNNVIGTIRVLEGCRKASVPKVVFASTSAIYENCKQFPLKEENVDQEPNLIYSMSKRNCEFICASYVENYGMDITTLRFFNVYGPHQDFKRKHPPLMGYITKSLLENSPPTFFSSGDQKRDYVYTEDISRMIYSIIKTPASKGEIFNVCSEKAYSVKEIYELYRAFFKNSQDPQFKKSEEFWDKYPELFECDYPLKKDRVIKEVNKYSLGSFSKAKRMLGWEPSVTMEEGVKHCVDYAIQSLA